MTWFSGIVVFVLVWWMMFFCILPLRIKSIEKPTDGSMPGAPVNPYIGYKILLTTLVASVVWFAIYEIIKADLISFRDIAQKMVM